MASERVKTILHVALATAAAEIAQQFIRKGWRLLLDLVHNSTALDFTFVAAHQRSELFDPFIRVTNSYNGLRALGFDIGFYRKICKNGMIVPDTVIRFKFTHLRRDNRQEFRRLCVTGNAWQGIAA